MRNILRALTDRIRPGTALAIRHRPHRVIETLQLGTRSGGRVIPANFLNPDSICYCAGAGEDLSFDTQLAERFGSRVWVIDPTPRAITHYAELRDHVIAGDPYFVNRNPNDIYDISPDKLDRLHYLPVGLWKKHELLRFYSPQNPEHVSHSIVNLQKTASYFEAEVKRMSELMVELGHDHVDLLKLDVEGAEYEVLGSILEDKLDVGVICAEYDEWHQALDDGSLDRINSSMSRLNDAGYVLVDMDLGSDCNVTYVRNDILKSLIRS